MGLLLWADGGVESVAVIIHQGPHCPYSVFSVESSFTCNSKAVFLSTDPGRCSSASASNLPLFLSIKLY